MKILISTIFIISSFLAFSKDIPTLWNTLKTGSAKERILASKELFEFYDSENRDSLRVIGEELFFYGIDEHYYPCVEQGKCVLAEYYILIGRTSEGLSMLKSLISNVEERKDDQKLGEICKLISQAYRLEKDVKSCFYWANRSVKLSRKSKDPKDRIKGQLSLAEAFLLKKDVKKAIETYLIYIEEAKKIKFYRGLSSAYARLGDVYRGQNDFSKASFYFKLSAQVAEKVSLTAPKAHAINNLAIISFETGDTLQAKNYFLEALAMRLKTGDRKSICESYYNLGDFYFYTENSPESIKWYQKSFEYAKSNNLKAELHDAIMALANVAKASKELNKTIEYLEQAIEVKDQMNFENLADDEEILKLQQEMFRLESSTVLSNEVPTFFDKYFKFEWLIILFLTVTIFLLMGRRKTKS